MDKRYKSIRQIQTFYNLSIYHSSLSLRQKILRRWLLSQPYQQAQMLIAALSKQPSLNIRLNTNRKQMQIKILFSIERKLLKQFKYNILSIQFIEQSFMAIYYNFFSFHSKLELLSLSLCINTIVDKSNNFIENCRLRYSLYIYTDYRYQASAFTLFKVVHENRGLSSVTLKGIYVSKFKQFLRANAQSKLNQIQEQKNEELRWMKDFRPLKSLKIAIDTFDYFELTNKEKDVCAIRDLALFGAMFEQFSVISVNIQLQEWKQLTTVTNTWQQFWKLIKMIGKMKKNVTLKGYYCQPFTVLLHMISFLTISQLQFINIQINSYIGINRFLAMQQILRTIFERKTLTSLKLYSCRNFPILPSLSTLQSIQFRNTSFWRPLNIVNELMRIWPSIISIRGYSPYRSIPYIEEKPFSQLQNIQIQDDSILDYINISVFSTHSTLNIESYSISESCVQPSVLFPQLKNITQLVLSIHIDHKQICVIPSPHLAKLRIIDNYLFVNQGLEAIDKKWPKLRQLYLRTCPRLNESGWSACEFKGLITLQVDPSILALGHHFRQQFRGRGIKVDW